jgi:hypothetical protein
MRKKEWGTIMTAILTADVKACRKSKQVKKMLGTKKVWYRANNQKYFFLQQKRNAALG